MALPSPGRVIVSSRYRKQTIHEMDDGSDVAVSFADNYIIEFELTWPNISYEIYEGIIEAYDDAGGMAETFSWTCPIDSEAYTCRFDSELRNTASVDGYHTASVKLKCYIEEP